MRHHDRHRTARAPRGRDPRHRLAVPGHGQGAILLLVRGRPARGRRWRSHRRRTRTRTRQPALSRAAAAATAAAVSVDPPIWRRGKWGPPAAARGGGRRESRSKEEVVAFFFFFFQSNTNALRRSQLRLRRRDLRSTVRAIELLLSKQRGGWYGVVDRPLVQWHQI